MKKISGILMVGILLFIILSLLTACGQDIPKESAVARYLQNIYGIKKFDIVDTGYDAAYFDGSKVGDYGYTLVSVDGVEIKVRAGSFGVLSDDYLSTVKSERNITEYVSDKYGALPRGVSLEARFEGTDKSKLKHFPITYEEIFENSEISVSYECEDFSVLSDNLQTLIDLRVRADIVNATIFNIGDPSESIKVLKDGRIISSARATQTERYEGVEYPYIDDDKIKQLNEEERIRGYNTAETSKKYWDRIKEITDMLDEIGYK